MSYSQNKEDLSVLEYFNGYKGNLLSIGENDGITLSNSRLLIENGWHGILVEPDLEPFKSLFIKYPHSLSSTNRIWCFNAAISNYNGESDFYSSGTHLNKNDKGLLSTLISKATEKWRKTTQFNKYVVPVWDFDNLRQQAVNSLGINKYDFITIDAEESDLIILRQMNLKELGCKCICVEHNGDQLALEEIKQICSWYGLTKQLLLNAENIVLVHE